MSLQSEIIRRAEMWQSLLRRGGPDGVRSSVVRNLGMYSGAAGIYKDTVNTSAIASSGVTVSILHTGRHYPDDITEFEIIYHYPKTERPGLFDHHEIEATKNTGKLGIPLFIITEERNLRNVKVGSVVSWDDESETFLIKFIEDIPVQQLSPATEEDTTEKSEFVPIVVRRRTTLTTRTSRPGQAKFKFDVIKRYGKQCAVCPVDVYSMLQAAHIIPVENNGSDDPRNGLVLCANHHIAYDQDLFSINPDILSIEVKEGGRGDFFITRENLAHLSKIPHEKALVWRYGKGKKKP